MMVSLIADGWRINDLEAVIFDKDGTLIDSHVYWGRIIERRSSSIIKHYSMNTDLFPQVCLAMGYSVDQKKLVPEGPIALVSREEVISILLKYLESLGILATEDEITDIFQSEHALFTAEANDYVVLLPYVVDFINLLHSKGIKLSIVTSDTVANTESIMEKLGIIDKFQIILGKESIKEAKVTGKPAVVAMEKMDVDPKRAVSVGDAPMDIIMAKNSGMKGGIGVSTGQIPSGLLLENTPYVVQSLGQIKVI